MRELIEHVRSRPALQQPCWADPVAALEAVRDLSGRAPLVRPGDIRALRERLAEVALGAGCVAQTGDCAEDPQETSPTDVSRRVAVLDLLARGMAPFDHGSVVRVGRIAGQYCKPRSNSVEHVGGQALEPYRGHLVNRPEPTSRRRRCEAANLLECHDAAGRIMDLLGWRGASAPRAAGPVWTSHEALALDYELPSVRPDGAGGLVLTSTHFPWIGERTRQHDGAHVALLAAVENPVGCKLGPGTEPEEALRLCALLDPHREPGRLTLVARMGADKVTERLPRLVEAVRAAGHPVIWLCDPMHGNTVTTPDGTKTRYLERVVAEIRGFRRAVAEGGGVAGGLHLESTPEAVTECVEDADRVAEASGKRTTLCDPRLNPRQAARVAAAWNAAGVPARAS
ncbi:3-deoxy-7-phosphoheptulonate synthase [Actinospica durhamensis]|uniref:Phospho-2-dehydro-3-deoxyheptonate aldolase n=1 Tax=Actinospica durhamensis TaxID=1508375 RepID=A0A941EUP2_9ACTN|nr:3-deoxy-7-phosphoheptulonate synthase [Actinospica durhamensis]MBR7837616.1 3-deoxy-7-phosphoheptulonate synthase [Actinospica durhamensis]